MFEGWTVSLQCSTLGYLLASCPDAGTRSTIVRFESR